MQSLSKSERLSSKKKIELLLKTGNHFFQFPFKVVFLRNDNSNERIHQFLPVVSKKKHRKAVDRNRIKRLIRESYRKNKLILASQSSNTVYYIALIYVHHKILTYSFIEQSIIDILSRINIYE